MGASLGIVTILLSFGAIVFVIYMVWDSREMRVYARKVRRQFDLEGQYLLGIEELLEDVLNENDVLLAYNPDLKEKLMRVIEVREQWHRSVHKNCNCSYESPFRRFLASEY